MSDASRGAAGTPPLKRLVLFAPFTDVHAVATWLLPPLCVVPRSAISDVWDNRAAIARTLTSAHPPARVTFVHGRLDEIVPFEMSCELARLAASTSAERLTDIHFASVDVDHNSVVAALWPLASDDAASPRRPRERDVFAAALLGALPLFGDAALQTCGAAP